MVTDSLGCKGIQQHPLGGGQYWLAHLFHGGLRAASVDKITKRAQGKLADLVPPIMQGQPVFWTRNNLWEAMWSAGIIWLYPPFPILYLLIGKLFMAKLMFPNNLCVGCGRCARFCPNQAIDMRIVSEQKRPFWTYHCEVCLRCMGFCRKKAIEAGHSWAVLLYFLASVPVISYGLNRLQGVVVSRPAAPALLSHAPLEYIDFVAALIITYRVFWHLIRIPVVNTLFTSTTLTHYFRRSHQPEIRLKHLGASADHPAPRGGASRDAKKEKQ